MYHSSYEYVYAVWLHAQALNNYSHKNCVVFGVHNCYSSSSYAD